jgi:hypothetical protein
MTRRRSDTRQPRRGTASITSEQFMELLGRVAPGAAPLGSVKRLDSRGRRQMFSVPVLVDEAQLKARSAREGRKLLASLVRVERRLLAHTPLSGADRRKLAATVRAMRRIVAPLLVGFE